MTCLQDEDGEKTADDMEVDEEDRGKESEEEAMEVEGVEEVDASGSGGQQPVSVNARWKACVGSLNSLSKEQSQESGASTGQDMEVDESQTPVEGAVANVSKDPKGNRRKRVRIQ